jgi:hypothetical protein
MWTVIHIVPNEEKANNINNKLTLDGFLVKIQPTNKNDENCYYQILVPETEAEEAYNLIMELGLS